MKYTQGTFTLPASENRTTQKEWDRIFLTEAEFSAKYGTPKEATSGER